MTRQKMPMDSFCQWTHIAKESVSMLLEIAKINKKGAFTTRSILATGNKGIATRSKKNLVRFPSSFFLLCSVSESTPLDPSNAVPKG